MRRGAFFYNNFYGDDFIKPVPMILCTLNYKLKGKLSDSFTNYNDVGNTKVSVSIKKT